MPTSRKTCCSTISLTSWSGSFPSRRKPASSWRFIPTIRLGRSSDCRASSAAWSSCAVSRACRQSRERDHVLLRLAGRERSGTTLTAIIRHLRLARQAAFRAYAKYFTDRAAFVPGLLAHLSSDGSIDMTRVLEVLHYTGIPRPASPGSRQNDLGEQGLLGYGLFDRRRRPAPTDSGSIIQDEELNGEIMPKLSILRTVAAPDMTPEELCQAAADAGIAGIRVALQGHAGRAPRRAAFVSAITAARYRRAPAKRRSAVSAKRPPTMARAIAVTPYLSCGDVEEPNKSCGWRSVSAPRWFASGVPGYEIDANVAPSAESGHLQVERLALEYGLKARSRRITPRSRRARLWRTALVSVQS